MQGQSPVSSTRSRSRSKGSRRSRHSSSSTVVDGIQYCDKFGKIGTYSGEVNADNIPHGKGVMKHDCGLKVEGWWVNGISLSTLKSFEFVPDQQQKDCPTYSVDRGAKLDPPSASDLTDTDSTSSNSTYSTFPSSTGSFNSHPEQPSQQQHSCSSRALEKKMSHHQEEIVPSIELASPRRSESSYHYRRYNTTPDPPCNDIRGGRAEYKKSNTSTPETVHADERARHHQRLSSLTSDSDDYKLMSRSRSKSPSAAIATQRSKSCSKSPLTRYDEISQNNGLQHDDDDEKKKKSAKLLTKMKSSLPSSMKLKKPLSGSGKGGHKFKVGDMAEYKISSRVDTDNVNYFMDGAHPDNKMCIVRILEIEEDASNKPLYKIMLPNGTKRKTGSKHLLPVATTKQQKRKESYRSLCLQTKLYEEQCALGIR